MSIRACGYSWFLLLSALASSAAAADIYGYVDAEGVPHFSNVPESSQYPPQYRLILADPEPDSISKGTRTGNSSRATINLANRAIYAQTINREARANRLDPLLVEAVIAVESGHNPNARSPTGAAGLMQLMPATARRYGVGDPYQADSNIRGGARYLRDLLSMFDGNLHLALAAYNAGENAVIRHGNKIPPYAETRDYVPKVMRTYAALKTPMPTNRSPQALP